ncbi:hypothetical protein DFJ77DRAFT_453267 [Powellomyces hirtus]|nr:hypothetical protein DFJ77DRAFT_453267 [Powellomyces hirtus]
MHLVPITLLTLAATPAIAGLVPRAANDNKLEGKKRWMDARVKAKKFDIRTQNGNSTGFRYTLSTSGFPRFRVEMYNGKQQEECSPTYTYAVGIHRVVEVNNTIGWRDSTSFLDLKNGNWTAFTLSNETATSGEPITKLSSTYTPLVNTNSASVVLYTHLSTQNAILPGSSAVLRPNSLKYGIDVNNFPYKYVNSSLAFIKAIYAVSTRNAVNATSISLGAAGTFTWDAALDITTKSGAVVKGSIKATQLIVPQLDGREQFALNNENDDDGESGDVTNGKETVSLVVFNVTATGTNAIHAKKVSWDPEMAVYTAFQGDQIVTSPSAAVRFASPMHAAALVAFGWVVGWLI